MKRMIEPGPYRRIPDAPCIMCVQYRGECSVPWGVFSTVGDIMSTVGDILSTVGGVQYRGGYHDKCGDILSTVGGVQ